MGRKPALMKTLKALQAMPKAPPRLSLVAREMKGEDSPAGGLTREHTKGSKRQKRKSPREKEKEVLPISAEESRALPAHPSQEPNTGDKEERPEVVQTPADDGGEKEMTGEKEEDRVPEGAPSSASSDTVNEGDENKEL